jgi:putative Mg2+ transporter-C (MgtC) family protein
MGGIALEIWEIVLRLFIALAVGGVVGMQREIVRSSAGFRTHTLVCLGACLAMLTNQFLFEKYYQLSTMDVARMGSYVLGGIGFLGAGTIVKDGLRVRGLTTAASLWVVAAIGLAVGCGFYVGALVVGAMTVLTLWILKFIEEKSLHLRGTVTVEMEILNMPGQLAAVLGPLVELGCSVQDVRMEHSEEEWIGLTLRLRMPRGVDLMHTKEKLGAVPGVKL